MSTCQQSYAIYGVWSPVVFEPFFIDVFRGVVRCPLSTAQKSIHPQRDVFASRQRSMRVLSVGIDALLGTTMRCDNYVAGGGLHFL